MSIINFEDYEQDKDCPELCNNDSFTFIEEEDGEWAQMLNDAQDYAEAYGLPFDHVMGAMIGGVWDEMF
jgi:hypothetical protein